MESYLTISLKTDCLWSGRVSQKLARSEEWQTKWIVVFKNGLYCFKSKADLKASVVFNLHVFQLSLDLDDLQPHLLILSNGLSKIKLGFSTRSELEVVVKGLHNGGIRIDGIGDFLGSSEPTAKKVTFAEDVSDHDANGNPKAKEPNIEEQELIAKLEQANLALIADSRSVGAEELHPDSSSTSSSSQASPVKKDPPSSFEADPQLSPDGSYTSFKLNESYAHSSLDTPDKWPLSGKTEAKRPKFSLFAPKSPSQDATNDRNVVGLGKIKSLFGKNSPEKRQSDHSGDSNVNTTIFRIKSIFAKSEQEANEVNPQSVGPKSSDLESFELHEAECVLEEIADIATVKPVIHTKGFEANELFARIDEESTEITEADEGDKEDSDIDKPSHDTFDDSGYVLEPLEKPDSAPIEFSPKPLPIPEEINSPKALVPELTESGALVVNYEINEQTVHFVTKFNLQEIEAFQAESFAPEPAVFQFSEVDAPEAIVPEVDNLIQFIDDDIFVVESELILVPPEAEINDVSSESDTESVVVVRNPDGKEAKSTPSRKSWKGSSELSTSLSPKKLDFQVSQLSLFTHSHEVLEEPKPEEEFVVDHHVVIALPASETSSRSDLDDFDLLEREAAKLQKSIEAKTGSPIHIEPESLSRSNSSLSSGHGSLEESKDEVLPEEPFQPLVTKHQPQTIFKLSRRHHSGSSSSLNGSQLSDRKPQADGNCSRLGTWPRKAPGENPKTVDLKASVSTSSLFDQLNEEPTTKKHNSVKKYFVKKAKQRSHSLRRSFRHITGQETEPEPDLKAIQQVQELHLRSPDFANFDQAEFEGHKRNSSSSLSLPIPEEESESSEEVHAEVPTRESVVVRNSSTGSLASIDRELFAEEPATQTDLDLEQEIEPTAHRPPIARLEDPQSSHQNESDERGGPWQSIGHHKPVEFAASFDDAFNPQGQVSQADLVENDPGLTFDAHLDVDDPVTWPNSPTASSTKPEFEDTFAPHSKATVPREAAGDSWDPQILHDEKDVSSPDNPEPKFTPRSSEGTPTIRYESKSAQPVQERASDENDTNHLKVAANHSREPSDCDSFERFEVNPFDADPFKEDPFVNERLTVDPLERTEEDSIEDRLPTSPYSGARPRLSLEPVSEEETNCEGSDQESRSIGTRPKAPFPATSLPKSNSPRKSQKRNVVLRRYDCETSSESDSELPAERAGSTPRLTLPTNEPVSDSPLHVPATQSIYSLKLRNRSESGGSEGSKKTQSFLEHSEVKDVSPTAKKKRTLTLRRAVRGIAKAVSLQDLSKDKSTKESKSFKWLAKPPKAPSFQSEEKKLRLTDTQLLELWNQGKDVKFKIGQSKFYVPSPRRIEIFEQSERIAIPPELFHPRNPEEPFTNYSTSSPELSPEKSFSHSSNPDPRPHQSSQDSFEDNFEANFDQFGSGSGEVLEEDPSPVEELEAVSEATNFESALDNVPTDGEEDAEVTEDTFKDCESLNEAPGIRSDEEVPIRQGSFLVNLEVPRIKIQRRSLSDTEGEDDDHLKEINSKPSPRHFQDYRDDILLVLNHREEHRSSTSVPNDDSDTFYSLESDNDSRSVQFSHLNSQPSGSISDEDEDTLQSNSSRSSSSSVAGSPKMLGKTAKARSRHSMMDYYQKAEAGQTKSRSKSSSPFKKFKSLFKSQPSSAQKAKGQKELENPLDPKRLNHNPLFLEDEMQDKSEYDPSVEEYRPRSAIPDGTYYEPLGWRGNRMPAARGKRNLKERQLATSFSKSDPTPIELETTEVSASSDRRRSPNQPSNLTSRYPGPARYHRSDPEEDTSDSEAEHQRRHYHQDRFQPRPKPRPTNPDPVRDIESEELSPDENESKAKTLADSKPEEFRTGSTTIPIQDGYGSETGVIDFYQEDDDYEDDEEDYSLEQQCGSHPDIIPRIASTMISEEKQREFESPTATSMTSSSTNSSVGLEASPLRTRKDDQFEGNPSPPSRTRSASLPRSDSPDGGPTLSLSSGGSIRKRGKKIQRSDSERSSKRKGKKITPPDTPPLIKGIMEVTLSPESRWRRRFLTVQDGLLLIFPKPDSKFASARVKLPHHGLHSAEEETGMSLTFKITRKSKTTLYMKADTVAEFGGWTQTLTSEIQRLSSTSIEDLPRDPTDSFRNSRDFDEDEPIPLDLSSLGPSSFVDDTGSTLSLPKQSPRTPVPAPRTSSASPSARNLTQSLEEYQEEPQVRKQDTPEELVKEQAEVGESEPSVTAIETPFPVKEVEIEAASEETATKMIPGSEEKEPIPYDSLEIANLERDRREGSLSPEGQPKIYINTSGQWVVTEEADNSVVPASPRVVSEDSLMDDDIPDDWKENNSLPIRRCVPVEDPGSSSSGEETNHSPPISAGMDVIEEIDEEEIYHGPKRSVGAKSSPPRKNYSPMERITSPELVQQVEKSFNPHHHYRNTADDLGGPIMRNQQHKPVGKPLTSAALQPMSPETASTFPPRHFHEFDIHNDTNLQHHHHRPGDHGQSRHASQKSSPSPPSSRSRSHSRQMEHLHHHHHHSSRFSEERISPDTITSNDSGVVDPHDEIFSPSGSVQGQQFGSSQSNICVKNIAKFWEDVSKKPEDEDEEEQNMRKKWFSMPDLKMKKMSSGSRKVRYEEPTLPPVLYEDDQENDSYFEEIQESRPKEARHTVSLASEAVKEHDIFRPVLRANYELDDRGVCALVPIKERKKLFEGLTSQTQMNKKKQWSSMPSLDMPKNKDTYQRHNYGQFSRQFYPPSTTPTGQALGGGGDAQSPLRKTNSVSHSPAEEDRTHIYHAKPAPIIPDYSHSQKSLSKETSDDYELTPLRDRMRAFQSPEKEPVSKPVVSMNKTVKPVNPAPLSLVTPIPQPEKKNNPAPATLHHARPYELDVPLRHSAEDDAASLADSVASSHTSSSTVISASKINGYSPNHPSLIPTYSWNDDSNGEIYNDKMDHNEVLYVVENGQEYPLESVSKRKSLFQSTDNLHESYFPKNSSLMMPKDIMKSEPMLLPEQKVREYRQSQYEMVEQPEDDEDDEILDQYEALVRASIPVEDRKYAIKASKVPYIEEEQDVLQRIKVVKAMKEKFLVH